MNIPQELKDRVSAKIVECFVTCFGDRADRFDITVVYDEDMGEIAGQASFSTSTIYLNTQLLLRNTEEFFSDIIPHEAAHIIADIKFPSQRKIFHGKAWKSVMCVLGCVPNRFHSLDTEFVTTETKYRYVCGCEDKTHNVSKIEHKKIVVGDIKRCRGCFSRLVYFPTGDTY